MAPRFYILFLLFTFCYCKAQKGDSAKISRYFFEANGGSGYFVKPYFVGSKNATLTGDYSMAPPVCVGLGSGINFHHSKKNFTERFLSVGVSLNYMAYKVNHQINNYVKNDKYSHFNHEFSRDKLSYYVNTINPSVFLSNSIIYPGGFFVRNRFGLSLITYVNKKSYTYTEHVTGSESVNVSPMPYIRYYEWTNTVREYNYDKLTYNAYYNLSLGKHFKNMVYYVSPELLIMDNQLHLVLRCQAGVLFFL